MLHSQARDGGDFSDHDRSRKEENCGLSFFPKCVARIQPGLKSRLTAGGFLRYGPIIRPAHSALASARQPPQPGLSICPPVNWFYTNAIDIFLWIGLVGICLWVAYFDILELA